MLIDRGALLEVDGRWVRGAGGRRHRRAADHPCAARGAARPARARRARDGRARGGDRAGVSAVRAVGDWRPMRCVRRSVDHLATLTRKQFVHLSVTVGRQRALPLPPPAGARHGLQRPAQARARAAAHRLRALGRPVNADRDRALEFEEILGYHLEQAHRYLSELGPLDAQGIAVGRRRRAAADLAGTPRLRARRHARRRQPVSPRRGAARPRAIRRRLVLLPEFGETLTELGDFAGALPCSPKPRRPPIAWATTGASQRRSSCCGCSSASTAASTGDWSEEALRMAHELIPLLRPRPPTPSSPRAWRLIGARAWHRRALQPGQRGGRALDRARAPAGNDRMVARNRRASPSNALLGPHAGAAGDRAVRAADRRRHGRPPGRVHRDVLAGPTARDERRARRRRARCTGGRARCCASWGRACSRHPPASTSLLRRAARRRSCHRRARGARRLRVPRARRARPTSCPRWLRCCRASCATRAATPKRCALAGRRGRDRGRRHGVAGAVAIDPRADRRPRGRLDEAESLARSAVELSQQSDAPQLQADALSELAAVLLLAGRLDEARQPIDDAIATYRAKGDVVSAARAAAWAAGLG